MTTESIKVGDQEVTVETRPITLIFPSPDLHEEIRRELAKLR